MKAPDRLAAIEARIARLEAREAALREWVVPAVWDALDRLYARTPEPEEPQCLACAFTAPAASFARIDDACAFGGGRLERLECPACGCIFGPAKYLQTPPPLVAADYRLLYAHYSEGDSTEAEVRAFHALNPRRGGLYLNWGSGAWSGTVDRLRAEGWDVWGYEPHAPVLKEGAAHPFVVRTRGEVSALFDGVFSNNVIEHLFDPGGRVPGLCGQPEARRADGARQPLLRLQLRLQPLPRLLPHGRGPRAAGRRVHGAGARRRRGRGRLPGARIRAAGVTPAGDTPQARAAGRKAIFCDSTLSAKLPSRDAMFQPGAANALDSPYRLG